MSYERVAHAISSGTCQPSSGTPYRRILTEVEGAPVKGLTATDFSVREDRTVREVLKAEPATEPMQIALLVDDSQAATSMIQPLREAITDFMQKLQGKTEIALITFGERPTTIVEYTSNQELLKKGVGRIFARPSAGPYLLEALVDASRGLERRKAQRPVNAEPCSKRLTVCTKSSQLRIRRVRGVVAMDDGYSIFRAVGCRAGRAGCDARLRGAPRGRPARVAVPAPPTTASRAEPRTERWCPAGSGGVPAYRTVPSSRRGPRGCSPSPVRRHGAVRHHGR